MYELDRSSPTYLRVLHLLQRIRMQQGRVLGCKQVKRLEEHIEHLQEQVSDAVCEFDQFHNVPAIAIFNDIDYGLVPDSWEHSRKLGDTEPILKWDWFPNPNAEPVEVAEEPPTPEQSAAREKMLAFLKSRNKRRWC